MSGIEFHIKAMFTFGQLTNLFCMTDNTVVHFVGAGRLRSICYDRKHDILTFVGEETEQEVRDETSD